MFVRFISGIYLKNFFIIFFGLLAFYCGVDLILNFKDLSASANLIILYVIFLAGSAINYLLPLSLVFALILSLFSMIRSNELISLYALGLSKNRVILWPFLWACFFCFVYIGLNFTSFAYSNEYKRNILKNGSLHNNKNEIFLKYNDEFIYINNQNINIFSFENGQMLKFSKSENARFFKDSYILKDANTTFVPTKFAINYPGFFLNQSKNKQILQNFNPKIIELLSSKSAYSLKDALDIKKLFNKQNIDTSELKNSFYHIVFTPFFAPFFMLLVHSFFPITARYSNLSLCTFVSLLSALIIFGALFLLVRLSENGVILGEFGIVLPILILMILSLTLKKKFI